MKKYTLDKAVQEAKRIRRNLLRLPLDYDRYERRFCHGLAGACGLASLLLAVSLDDVSILRGHDSHVWTVVHGRIVDITATQFNTIGTYNCDDVRGVLVTDKPRPYHETVKKVGVQVYREIVNYNWYDSGDYKRWRQVAEHWL